MSDAYTKLFGSITESTIWSEPAGTRLVWITFLAKCNKHGEVFGSVPGIARLANVSLEECAAAIETLLTPDKWSRTPDNEGRRIGPIDGGWQILNHAKFDAIRNASERAEYKRQWDKENRRNRPNAAHRTPDKNPDNSDSATTVPTPPTPTPLKKEQEQKIMPHSAKRGTRLLPDWQPTETELRWAEDARPDVDAKAEVEKFRDYWIAKTGRDASKRDWPATWRNWIRNSRGSYADRSTSRKLSVVEQIEQNIADRKQREAHEARAIVA
jgi:hypothetical protein